MGSEWIFVLEEVSREVESRYGATQTWMLACSDAPCRNPAECRT